MRHWFGVGSLGLAALFVVAALVAWLVSKRTDSALVLVGVGLILGILGAVGLGWVHLYFIGPARV